MTRSRVKSLAGLLSATSLFLTVVYLWPLIGAWFHVTIPELSLSVIPSQVAGESTIRPDEDAVLIIPKLGIQAPITKNVPITSQWDYEYSLKEGVALAAGTAGLESSFGNSFIFGHSANDGKKSQYDTIFVRLADLKPDDEIQISVGGRESIYKVSLSKEIEKTEVEYLQSTPIRQLTLVTCWPPGTTYKRWAVQAVQVN